MFLTSLFGFIETAQNVGEKDDGISGDARLLAVAAGAMLHSLSLIVSCLGQFPEGCVVRAWSRVFNETVDALFRLGDLGLLLPITQVLIDVIDLTAQRFKNDHAVVPNVSVVLRRPCLSEVTLQLCDFPVYSRPSRAPLRTYRIREG